MKIEKKVLDKLKKLRNDANSVWELSKVAEKCCSLKIKSKSKKVKKVLKELFDNRLELDNVLRFFVIDLISYGNCFVYLKIDKDKGITDCTIMPVTEIFREEGHDGKIDSVRFKWDVKDKYFEEWELAHFRTLIGTYRLPYGTSLLESKKFIPEHLQSAEIKFLQKEVLRGLTKIANIHLYFLGYGGDGIDNFKLSFEK